MQDSTAVFVKEEILSRLDGLADKMGVAVDHLWGVFIDQATIEVAVVLFGTGLVLLGWFVYCRLWVFWDKKLGEYTGVMDGPETGMPFLIGGFVLGCLSVVAVVGLLELPTLILNPEYWAFMEILDLIGS